MRPRSSLRLPLAALLSVSSIPASAADEAFKLFEEEARVVSASHAPTTVAQAPATVRVIGGDELRASGVRDVWDALRRLPGVDVMQTRAAQGEVGIRGLVGPLHDRVLVLLDGRAVLNPMFDYLTWETLPVTLEEIERVEVVQGPASALYGANAVSGVVNIITKSPERLGGRAAVSGGRGNAAGAALYGRRSGRLDYKVSGGARAVSRFDDQSRPAARSGRFHGAVGWEPDADSRLALSAGLAALEAQTTTGGSGAAFETGTAGFLRGDYRRGASSARAYWNRERAVLREFGALNEPGVDYDAFDLNVRHEIVLPLDNDLTVGGSYRRNEARSSALDGGAAAQDLWALFMENRWRASERWTAAASVRLDRHPLTPFTFSPRGSVIYSPGDVHTFRASVGTSFRNPTMLESYLRFTQTVPNPGGDLPNPPFTSYTVATDGRRNLSPEHLFQVELAHAARLGAVSTSLTGWYYRLKDRIIATPPAVVSAVAPTASLAGSYANQGALSAVGLEAGLDARLGRGLDGYVNWSYQSLRDDAGSRVPLAGAAPRHKVNAGFAARRGGWSGTLWGGWVDATARNEAAAGGAAAYKRLPDRVLLHGRVAYAFAGAWSGLELSLAASDLLDRGRVEALPSTGAARPGDNAETLRARWTAGASCRF